MSPQTALETGTFTAGYVVLYVNDVKITENFSIDKETTFTNLATSIQAQPDVTSCTYDFANGLFTFISDVSLKVRVSYPESFFSGSLAFTYPRSVVMREYQNIPKQEYNYASFHIGAVSPESSDTRYAPDSDGVSIVQAQEKFICSVQFFGAYAMEYAENLRMSLNIQTVRDSLLDYAIVIYDSELVMNVSVLLDIEYEIKSSFAFYCRSYSTIKDRDTGLIETVGDIVTTITN
ncbi:MAG: hypothetical protein GY861_25425 [bacterium]|nr:hypothetical protein [bacterium]